jgi:cysteine desulfurase
MARYLVEEYGNAGSRTHTYGVNAKQGVENARREVAEVVDAEPDEVIFTSGATEANNLAILGLANAGQASGRMHLVSTQIEHKAVLEPHEHLRSRGFSLTLIPPCAGGWVDPAAIVRALQPDTLLVSVMAANNETGVLQPIDEIAACLANHAAYLHVDAAQVFGKEIDLLRATRIDLLSVSGHKIYGPKGIGALVVRRRGFSRPPLEPLMHGGGQERGLRPGTLPVPLVVGLGKAAALALREHSTRRAACLAYRRQLLDEISPLGRELNGDQDRCQPHVLNVSLLGLDSEAAMVALKDVAALSNGSACTSAEYKPSHVLQAMGLPESRIRAALRFSWHEATRSVPPLCSILTPFIARRGT